MTKRNFPGPLDDVRALLKLIPMGKEAQLRVAIAWRIEADERKMQVLGETARSRIQDVSGITREPTFDTAMGGVQKLGLFKAKRVYSRRGKRTYQRSAEYLVLRDAWPTDDVTYAERNLRPAYLTPDTHSSLTPSVSDPLTPSVSDLSISNDEVYDEVNDEGTHTPPNNLRDLNSPKLKNPTPTPPPVGVVDAHKNNNAHGAINGVETKLLSELMYGNSIVSYDQAPEFLAVAEKAYGATKVRVALDHLAWKRRKGIKVGHFPAVLMTACASVSDADAAAFEQKHHQEQQEARKPYKSPYGRYTKATLGEKL